MPSIKAALHQMWRNMKQREEFFTVWLIIPFAPQWGLPMQNLTMLALSLTKLKLRTLWLASLSSMYSHVIY